VDKVLEKLRDAYLAAGLPASAHVDLTWECPLRCRHCYLQTRRVESELGTADVLGVLDQLRELGTLVVLFSGGEVLLRSDLKEILSGAVERGFGVRLKTTGVGAPEGFPRFLAALGPVSVDISFYGADAATHDWVTRCAGSFETSLAFVQELARVGVPVRGVLTPLRGATTDPREAASKLLSLGIPFVDYNYYSQVGCGTAEAATLSLGEELESRFMQAVIGDRPFEPEAQDPEERGCYACQLSLYVAPNGQVGPCVDFPAECGSVLESPVAELWKRVKERIDRYNPRLRERPVCLACELSRYGSYCPALALAQTGDPRTPGSELCETCRAIERAVRRQGEPK